MDYLHFDTIVHWQRRHELWGGRLELNYLSLFCSLGEHVYLELTLFYTHQSDSWLFLRMLCGHLQLLGMGVATLGFLLRFNSQLFETYILDILTSAEVDNISLKEVIESVAIVVIVIGFIIALIGLMGCIGGCCKIKTLLVVVSSLSGSL